MPRSDLAAQPHSRSSSGIPEVEEGWVTLDEAAWQDPGWALRPSAERETNHTTLQQAKAREAPSILYCRCARGHVRTAAALRVAHHGDAAIFGNASADDARVRVRKLAT